MPLEFEYHFTHELHIAVTSLSLEDIGMGKLQEQS